MTDAFAKVAELPGVLAAGDAARSAVDGLFWDRGLRDRLGSIAGLVANNEARASAALDGADLPLELVVSGAALDETPMGKVVAAALRATTEGRTGAALIDSAPLQLLARLAAQVGRDFLPHAALGQPRIEDEADDPLHLGGLPPVVQVLPRLAGLSRLLAAPTVAPALVVAAVVHGELLALRPFGFGSGLVARAAGRSALISRGVDPLAVLAPSAGLAFLGRSAYVSAARAYLSGTPGGVAAWVLHCCLAVERAVDETRVLLD